jgi:hypothetical protein
MGLKRTAMPRGPQWRLVLVEWLDSHYIPEWHYDEPLTEPKVCRSVGWLVYEGPKAITIAAHVAVEDAPQRSGEMIIPAQAVINIKTLR